MDVQESVAQDQKAWNLEHQHELIQFALIKVLVKEVVFNVTSQ